MGDLRSGITTRGSRAQQFLYSLTAAVVSLAALASLWPAQAAAVPLSERSLRLSDVKPGATTTHAFSFSYASPDAVGSVRLEYCTSPLPDIACVAPAGLDASGAALSDQTGETGFTMASAQPNVLILGRAAATAPVNNVSTYTFSTIVNPGGAPDTFFVRISTYGSSDGTGAAIDFGAVANATTDNVVLNTEVPPILKFCVGLTLGTDCSTADDNLIDLGDLSPSRAASGSSQMLAATNAQFGLAIAAYGTTMTSGNNTVAALNVPTVSAPGNAQFGINLRKNTDPAVGQEPSGSGISIPTAAYNTPNRYMFRSGDVVATSPDATDIRTFTSSYVVNVTPSQPPGVYTATLTYICTATF
jgi:hypothetical protein